jgi:hypothetical protein
MLTGHSLRQYKSHIRQMKLERNVKAKDRKTVVRHIQHRTHAVGKSSRLVRVRGHKISSEKLSRWMREVATNQSLMPQPPLSRKLESINLGFVA